MNKDIDAIGIVRQMIADGQVSQEVAEKYFPELKESEDERLGKELIRFIKGYFPDETSEQRKAYLAWIERHGEKKSIWHNEDENPQKGSLILLIMQSGTPIVAKIIEPNHTFNHGERWAYIDDLLERQDKQDAIAFNDAHIIDSALNDYCCKQYDALHNENGGVLSFARLQHLAMDIYGWCKKQNEQKPTAWSEEDEQMLNHIIKLLDGLTNLHNWLKSLKDRIGCEANRTTMWKPTEEQIKAVEEAACYSSVFSEKTIDNLISLSKQLKKLRER